MQEEEGQTRGKSTVDGRWNTPQRGHHQSRRISHACLLFRGDVVRAHFTVKLSQRWEKVLRSAAAAAAAMVMVRARKRLFDRTKRTRRWIGRIGGRENGERGEWERRSEGINKVKRKRARHGGGQGRQQLLPESRPAGSAPFLPGGRSPARSSLLPFPWVWSGRSRSDSRQSVTGRRTGTTLTGFPDAPRRIRCLFPTRSRFFSPQPTGRGTRLPEDLVSASLLSFSNQWVLKFRTDLDRRWIERASEVRIVSVHRPETRKDWDKISERTRSLAERGRWKRWVHDDVDRHDTGCGWPALPAVTVDRQVTGARTCGESPPRSSISLCLLVCINNNCSKLLRIL